VPPEADEDRRMVVVCSHVLEGGLPILFLRRDGPTEPADSGWQATCNRFVEDESACRLIAVSELVQLDATVGPFLSLPVGSELRRESGATGWHNTCHAPSA